MNLSYKVIVVVLKKKIKNYFFRKGNRYFWKREKFFGYSIMKLMKVVVMREMNLLMNLYS